MLSTLLETGRIVIVAIIAVCLVVRIIGYCYLEFANNYNMHPLYKTGFEMLTFYEKPVKPAHEIIKKIINKALQALYMAFVLSLFFSIIVAMFIGVG